MAIYILSSRSIPEIREADLINLQLICPDNESYLSVLQGGIVCIEPRGGGVEWDLLKEGEKRERTPAGRDAEGSTS